MLSSHSLIDASDKPLRRSPTGLQNHVEEWPVLQPRRLSSAGTLREMMRETGNQLNQQAVSGQQERYPVLGNTTLRQVPDEDQLPVSRYSAQHKIPRKEVASPKVQKQLEGERGSNIEKGPDEKEQPSRKKSIDDPFRDGVYNTDLSAPSEDHVSSPSIHPLSRSIKEPRQNKTSSLRARLSAGHIVNIGQSQSGGPTSFTTLDEQAAGAVQRDSLRGRKEVEGRRSITPPVMQPLRTKASREAVASRAPAKFVAGSRRPSHTHRPSSRGSLRDEARAAGLPASSLPPPNRAAPTRPNSEEVRTDIVGKQAGPNTNQRVSSIPISRKRTPDATTQGVDNISQQYYGKAKSIEVGKFSPKKEARNESSIYNEHSSQDLMNDLNGTPPPRPIVNRLVPFLIDDKNAHVLEAIEESPQRAYQIKRLSMNSPDYGPTLKISPSAERFIMGSKPMKGDRSVREKPSKESEGAKTTDGLKVRKSSTSSISSAEKLPERPSTSQGLTRLGSRIGLIDPAGREKKVKSADVSLSSPKVLEQGSAKAYQQSHGLNDDNFSVRGSGTSTGTAPYFFDAPEESLIGDSKVTTPVIGGENKQSAPSEEMWISPPKINAVEEVPSSNRRSSVDPPKQNLDHLGKHATHTEYTNPFQDSNLEAQDIAKLPEGDMKKVVLGLLPSTPQPTTQGKVGTQPGSLPPRSSSRMAPPDWTSNKKSPSPPITAEKIPPPTPPKPKTFAHRQNDLGFQRGNGSSQVNLLPQSKHDSLRDSVKSQASLPKGNGVLSNLKGLFHKRSSENEPPKSGTKTKPKVTITRNGSPYGPYPAYPPISEIHPVHRPTLASARRSKTSTPIQKALIPSTNPTTPATPCYASPPPTNISNTSAMAIQILDAARDEETSPKKERLMKLGEVMVAAITRAGDAEKAMEEAKQAARRAEVAHVLCQKSLGDVNRCVREWSGSRVLDGGL